MKFSAWNNKRGFTLIELLVVMSIISMLASVVLVAVQGARAKGQVGAGLTFASYTYQALGASAYLIYNFNEPAGSVKDTSGNTYNGVIGGPDVRSYNVPASPNATSGNNTSYTFDGSSDVITVPSSTNMPLTANYSLDVWVYPTGVTGPYGVIVRSYFSSPGVCAGDCVVLALRSFDNTTLGGGVEYGNPADAWASHGPSIPLNAWTNIAYSVNGPVCTLYENGKIVDVKPTCFAGAGQGTVLSPIGQLSLGSYAGTSFFKGNMDDFSIYNQALTDAQVQEIYAVGLPQHKLASAL